MEAWHHLAEASLVALALDLDGTLIPFAPSPDQALLDDDGAQVMDLLHDAAGLTTTIVSGRPRRMLDDLAHRWPRLGWVGEHGAWRRVGGVWHAAVPAAPELDSLADQLARALVPWPTTLIERKSAALCVHWRRLDPITISSVSPVVHSAMDEWLETHPDFERIEGAMTAEVRHRFAHKGRAVSWLVAQHPEAMVLAVGDDVTDEDMFIAVPPSGLGVVVGDRSPSAARARLGGVAEVRSFLRWLVAARAGKVVVRPELLPVAHAASHGAASLVVVSNRLPVLGGGREREVGGLVSALEPVVVARGGVWLGWSGTEREPGLQVAVDDAGPVTTARFDYPPGWRQHYYVGFCNRSLWPLLHSFPGRVRYVDQEWRTYVEANAAYARHVLTVAGPDAPVWAQDYHLLLLGQALVDAGHRGRRGLFLHVPFPGVDVFATLPWATQVLEAMAAFHVVGVQTQRDRRNYVDAVAALVGPEAGARAEAQAQVFPVGIDPRGFERALAAPAPPDIAALRGLLGQRRLILGVDRLDYSKGVPERLEAYARFLDLHPAWCRRVTMVQISVPSRSDVPEYQELRDRVEALVGRINGHYGEADWVPVRYMYRSYQQAALAHLYRMADVAMVTPLRDGMNLVAKEFIASQRPDDPGVLLLSRFAGCADRMPGAVLANPYHCDGLAESLRVALELDANARRDRWDRCRPGVFEDTAAAWADGFLDALRAPGT